MTETKIKSFAGDSELVLFGRVGCAHCDQLQLALGLLVNQPGSVLERIPVRYVSIDGDTELESHYNEIVPVLCWGKRVVVAGAFDIETLGAELQRAFEADS